MGRRLEAERGWIGRRVVGSFVRGELHSPGGCSAGLRGSRQSHRFQVPTSQFRSKITLEIRFAFDLRSCPNCFGVRASCTYDADA